MPASIEFKIDGEVRAAAVFIAQLIREGVTYTLYKDAYMIRVTITGGF